MSRRISLLLALLIAAGCGSSKGSGGGLSTASTTPGSTASNHSGSTTTPGSTPGGVTVTPGTGTGTGTGAGTGTTIQTNGPTITITSPGRASFATQPGTMVTGTVTDPAGVVVLTVNGQPVAPAAGGAFSAPLTLTTGLNVVVVEATNGLNMKSKESLSVLYGQFQPDTQPIKDALAVRLNKGTFDAVSQIVGTKLTGQMLTTMIMARNPLFSKTISIFGLPVASAEVDATNATFGNPTVLLTPQVGDLLVHVEIPNVFVEVKVHDVPGSGIIPYSITGHVSADKAIFDAQIAVAIAPGGAVTTSVINDTISFQNFNWGINGFPSLLTGLATGIVQNQVQTQISNMVKTVLPAEVNKMLAGATGKPITQTIMGSTVSVTVTPTALSFDAMGASLLTDADLSLSPVPGYTPLPAPGSLYVAGAAPNNGGPLPGFYASINENFMNRAGYAVWKSGVARVEIDQSPASLVKLPAWIPLDMGLLQLFIPELVGKAPATDPISIVVTPLLPPVFQVQSGPDLVQAGLGDMTLQIWDTAAPAPKLVLAIALHVKVAANATINAQNAFDIKIGSQPFIDASLAASPLAPTVNTIGLDNLIGWVAPPLVQLVGNMWSGFPLPLYQGVGVANVTIYQDGAQGTFVTAKGDVH